MFYFLGFMLVTSVVSLLLGWLKHRIPNADSFWYKTQH